MSETIDSRAAHDPAYAAPFTEEPEHSTNGDKKVVTYRDPKDRIILQRTIQPIPLPQRISRRAPLSIEEAIKLVEQKGNELHAVEQEYAEHP
ncbi:MAG: hypothetical protein JO076_16900 [Verrucomicrobia bacterium]|nr:hypothetical protein [Verrucomicrobiota bacterium]